MILGAISSTDKKDLRSAIHPDTIKYLLDMGIEVIFESGAGNIVDVTNCRTRGGAARGRHRSHHRAARASPRDPCPERNRLCPIHCQPPPTPSMSGASLQRVPVDGAGAN